MTKEKFDPVLVSKQKVCSNVLIEKKTSEGVLHSKGRNVYMVPFFNLLYYFCYFPIKFHFDKEKDKYFVTTNRVQKIFCIISQIYTLSFLLYYTISVAIKILRQDGPSGGEAIQIFEATSNAGLAATSAFSIHLCWKRGHLILEIIERTRVTCLDNRKLRIICALVYGCSITIIVGFGILEWVLKMRQNYDLEQAAGSSDNYTSQEPVFLPTVKETDGKDNFFDIFGNYMNSSYVISIGKVVIVAFLFTYLILYYSVCHALFMLLMLTMKQTGNEYRKRLKAKGYQEVENGDRGLNKGIELYREIKTTTKLFRKLFGNSMMGYYIATVAYLAVAPHILLGKQRKFERIVIIYSAFSFLLWIIAAEFHHQVRSSFLKWTEHHFARNDLSTDNRLRLFSISHDISSTEPTSIAVANKCFAVTYTHLCSMFSIIVTYGIIVFQLHYGQFQATNSE